MMFRENAAAGDVLWSDGDTDAETFHILLRGGPIREVKEGETVRTLRMGDVSRHDIAGIWVAFFQERQQYRCGQIISLATRARKAARITYSS